MACFSFVIIDQLEQIIYDNIRKPIRILKGYVFLGDKVSLEVKRFRHASLSSWDSLHNKGIIFVALCWIASHFPMFVARWVDQNRTSYSKRSLTKLIYIDVELYIDSWKLYSLHCWENLRFDGILTPRSLTQCSYAFSFYDTYFVIMFIESCSYLRKGHLLTLKKHFLLIRLWWNFPRLPGSFAFLGLRLPSFRFLQRLQILQ